MVRLAAVTVAPYRAPRDRGLDYPPADRWGVALTREQTLSGGADHCDFRYHHRSPGE